MSAIEKKREIILLMPIQCMRVREREGERVAIVKEKSTDLYTVFPKTKHKL